MYTSSLGLLSISQALYHGKDQIGTNESLLNRHQKGNKNSKNYCLKYHKTHTLTVLMISIEQTFSLSVLRMHVDDVIVRVGPLYSCHTHRWEGKYCARQQPDGPCKCYYVYVTLHAVKSSVLKDSLISASFFEDELPVALARLSITFLKGRRFILIDYISIKSSKKKNNSMVNIPDCGSKNAPENWSVICKYSCHKTPG